MRRMASQSLNDVDYGHGGIRTRGLYLAKIAIFQLIYVPEIYKKV